MVDVSEIEPRFEAARSLLLNGRLQDADNACRLLRADFPNQYPVLHLSSAIANASHRFEEAVGFFKQALALKDGHFQTHLFLAQALFGLGRYKEARSSVKRSLKLNKNSADAYVLRARLHQEQFQSKNAFKDLDRAIALNPSDKSIGILKVQMMRYFGKQADAIKGLEDILRREPHYVPALYELAMARRFSSSEPLTSSIQALIKQNDLNTLERTKLLFALGKVHDDCNAHKEAFSYFRETNNLRQSLNSRPKSWVLDLKGLAAIYTSDFFAAASSEPQGEITPIFIVGLPRCGSTLVEHILNAHPKVQSYGETDHLAHSVSTILKGRTGSNQLARLPQFSGADLEDIRAQYFDRLEQHAPLKPFIVDKNLANMISVSAIRFILTQSKIIYCRRDVRDMGLSIYFNYFGDEDNAIAFSHDLDDIAIHARSYDALALIWKNALPGLVSVLSYEKLVTSFEPMVRRLLGHCGLDWDDACLDFQPKHQPVRTLIAAQVREEVNTRDIGKWKPYADDIAPLIACAEETSAQDRALPEI